MQSLAAHPTEASSILSATHGNNEVAVWNMESGSRTQAFWGCAATPLTPHRVRTAIFFHFFLLTSGLVFRPFLFSSAVLMHPLPIIFVCFFFLCPVQSSTHYIRAICSHRALGPNCVLLGGTDRRIRVFDLVHPLSSNVLISLCKDHDGAYQPAKYR